jgi:hypothetical protein
MSRSPVRRRASFCRSRSLRFGIGALQRLSGQPASVSCGSASDVRLFGATRAVIGDLISAEKCTEPVFGQIKQARGFRQFLLRGV